MIRPLLALLILAGITATPAQAQNDAAAASEWAPPGAGRDGFTWVQLISDEWVKGEIKDLRDGNLSFDSDELAAFDYDWADVKAIITSEPHTVTTWDRQVYTGMIVARPHAIRVLDESGATIATITPDQVSSMIQGPPQERNFWSGDLSVGSTVRTGNSDQSDANVLVNLNRRALATRWDNSAQLNAASSGGEKTQESHRYTSKFDYFVTRSFFITFGEYEYFRDPFQNIRQRHTPGVAFGYDMRVRKADLDLSAGLAWQYLEYDSVEVGESTESDGLVGRVSANLDWDITSDLEFDLTYSINVPFEEANYYTSNLLSQLSLDIWWNFELDLTFAWDRQNAPQADADGVVPEKDDFRLTTGIGWDF